MWGQFDIVHGLCQIKNRSKFHPSNLSRSQSLIELFNNYIQLLPEELMHSAQTAFLDKGRIVKIFGFNAEIGGNMVTDHYQPLALLACKLLAS